MTGTGVERGDTFIVHEDRFRGSHFTCTGVFDDGFYAGDTNGRMYLFESSVAMTYEVYEYRPSGWRYRGEIYAESIRQE